MFIVYTEKRLKMIFPIVVIMDQIIKSFVENFNFNLPVWGDFFNFYFVKNTGGVYGLLEGKNVLFALFSFVILAYLVYYVYKNCKKNSPEFIAWQFVIAGGVSNLIDRVFRGYVVDFVQLQFGKFLDFGVFNIADVCIVFGVIFIAFFEINSIIKKRLEEDDN